MSVIQAASVFGPLLREHRRQVKISLSVPATAAIPPREGRGSRLPFLRSPGLSFFLCPRIKTRVGPASRVGTPRSTCDSQVALVRAAAPQPAAMR